MKYEKPEVFVLEPACAVIQSVSKAMGSPDSAHQFTTTAYEADE